MDLHFFKNELESETNQLKKSIKIWEEKLENKINLPESARGDIDVAIGLASLLIQQRFAQFRQLIRDCEFNTGAKVIKLDDLRGFWDMIRYQIEDVKRHFRLLDVSETNNWEEKENAPDKSKKVKKFPAKSSPKPTTALSEANN